MSLSKLTQSTVSGQFRLGMAEAPWRPWVTDLSIDVSTPGQLSVPYGFVSEVPKLSKISGGKGEDDTERPLARRLTILNEEYQVKESWRLFDQDNDQTGQLLDRVTEYGFEITHLQWRAIRDLIVNGNSAGYTSWDGQLFFDTDHSYDGSGTQKNLLTTTEVPQLIVANVNKVTPEEMAAAIWGMISYGLRMLDGKGRPMNQGTREVTVAVPAQMIASANIAITANVMHLSQGATNVLAAQNRFTIKLLEIPELSSQTAFYVFFTGNKRRKPFIFQTHTAPRVDFLGAGTEYAKENGAVLVRPYMAFGAGYGEPLTAFKGTVATS